MEIIILVSLDLLFLILLAYCVSLDKRLTGLEKKSGRSAERLTVKIADCRRELAELKRSLEPPEPRDGEESDGTEQLKEKLAEKRFTDGIASILAYDSDSGRRAAHAERK